MKHNINIEKEQVNVIVDDIIKHKKNIILTGEVGAGKKTILKQVCSKLENNKKHCVFCEFDQNYSRNTDNKLNIVHQIAHSFENYNLNEELFNLVDFVYCEKFDFLPRSFFKTEVSSSVMTEVFSIGKELVDLTSFGIGNKIMTISQSLYEMAKENSIKIKLKELKPKTQNELLEEYKIPILSSLQGNLVVIFSNFDHFNQEEKDYIYSFSTANKNIRFIYATTEKNNKKGFKKLEIAGFTPEETKQYLTKRFKDPQYALEYFSNYNNVLPSYLEVFCVIFEKNINDLSKISEILKNDESIAKDIVQELTQDKKDILILLSLVDEVNMDFFEAFFENLFFGNYIEWFNTPLFDYNESNDSVSLKKYYKNPLTPFNSHHLMKSYYQKIIQIYLNILEQNIERQDRDGVHQFIRIIFSLCDELGSKNKEAYDFKFKILNKYYPIAQHFALETQFAQEFAVLFEIYKEDKNQYKEKQLICQSKIINIYVSQGKYNKVKPYLIEYKNNYENNDKNSIYLYEVLKASLGYYQNTTQKQNITQKNDSFKQYEIELAEKLLELNETLEISVEQYYKDKIKLNTYLAKAYMAGIDSSKSRDYLDNAMEVPEEAVTIFKLYRQKAFSYMVSGELYTKDKKISEAFEELEKAVKYYKYATTLDPYDLNAMSEFGLTYKRISENYQKNNQINEAEDCMKKAIEIYKTVQKKNPTSIDIYQKIGFANSELAGYLMKNNIKDKPLKYCNEAIIILEEGLDYLEQIGEDDRKIRNALCQAYRTSFEITIDLKDLKKLEISLNHARASITCANENALGYMEFITTAILLKKVKSCTFFIEKEVALYVDELKKINASDEIIKMGEDFLNS